MLIYLDVLFIYNSFINFIIIKTSAHLNKINIRHYKIIISSCIGAFFSITSTLCLKNFSQNILKIMLPPIMCAICSRQSTVKIYIKLLITHNLISYIFSGVMLNVKYIALNTNNISVSALDVITSILFFFVLYKTSISYFRRTIQHHNNYCEITIIHNGIILNLLGYNDTGNSLTSLDNVPIFICDTQSLAPILNNTSINFVNYNCSTILENGSIKTFTPDCIKISDVKIEAILGISNIPLNADYDVLVNINNLTYNEMEINYV